MTNLFDFIQYILKYIKDILAFSEAYIEYWQIFNLVQFSLQTLSVFKYQQFNVTNGLQVNRAHLTQK
jgi:hypothetical protein